jgi:hypothetical protein
MQPQIPKLTVFGSAWDSWEHLIESDILGNSMGLVLVLLWLHWDQRRSEIRDQRLDGRGEGFVWGKWTKTQNTQKMTQPSVSHTIHDREAIFCGSNSTQSGGGEVGLVPGGWLVGCWVESDCLTWHDARNGRDNGKRASPGDLRLFPGG